MDWDIPPVGRAPEDDPPPEYTLEAPPPVPSSPRAGFAQAPPPRRVQPPPQPSPPDTEKERPRLPPRGLLESAASAGAGVLFIGLFVYNFPHESPFLSSGGFFNCLGFLGRCWRASAIAAVASRAVFHVFCTRRPEDASYLKTTTSAFFGPLALLAPALLFGANVFGIGMVSLFFLSSLNRR